MKKHSLHFAGIIILISTLILSISFCRNQSNSDGILIIPLKIGLAKNNGATPWFAELLSAKPQTTNYVAGRIHIFRSILFCFR